MSSASTSSQKQLCEDVFLIHMSSNAVMSWNITCMVRMNRYAWAERASLSDARFLFCVRNNLSDTPRSCAQTFELCVFLLVVCHKPFGHLQKHLLYLLAICSKDFFHGCLSVLLFFSACLVPCC